MPPRTFTTSRCSMRAACEAGSSWRKRSQRSACTARRSSASSRRCAVPSVPTAVWGRDELHAGEMWNSNSLISWLIVSAGLDASGVQLPDASIRWHPAPSKWRAPYKRRTCSEIARGSAPTLLSFDRFSCSGTGSPTCPARVLLGWRGRSSHSRAASPRGGATARDSAHAGRRDRYSVESRATASQLELDGP